MAECIFCSIAQGTIPSAKIYEDDDVISFLDLFPVQKGHALVISKEHYKTLDELPEEIFESIARATKKIAKAIRKATDSDGYNIQMNNYPDAGQVVMHAHVHIVPRFKDDGLKLWPGSKYAEGEQEKYKDKILHFL